MSLIVNNNGRFERRWHTDDSPNVLVGLEITPNNWAERFSPPSEEYRGPTDKAVVEAPNGNWGYLEISGFDPYKKEPSCQTSWATVIHPDKIKPIYPPRGWGGLSEEELWDAVCHHPHIPHYVTLGVGSNVDIDWRLKGRPGVMGTDEIYFSDDGYCFQEWPWVELPNRIMQLQNALILAQRMGWLL